MTVYDRWWSHDDHDIVEVERVIAPKPASTTALGEGIRVRDGARVIFAGDWSPMMEVAETIRDTGKTVTAAIPRHAILKAIRPEPVA